MSRSHCSSPRRVRAHSLLAASACVFASFERNLSTWASVDTSSNRRVESALEKSDSVRATQSLQRLSSPFLLSSLEKSAFAFFCSHDEQVGME